MELGVKYTYRRERTLALLQKSSQSLQLNIFSITRLIRTILIPNEVSSIEFALLENVVVTCDVCGLFSFYSLDVNNFREFKIDLKKVRRICTIKFI